MGISILEFVLQKLRQEGFAAETAYPGQKYSMLTESVAAVHLKQVDRAGLSVTVEVNIISPAAQGGTACELQALRATEVLRWAGASCVQQGCRYDGAARVYMVAVLATFTCVTKADDCIIGPGFTVSVNGRALPGAICFTAENVAQHQMQYSMGENVPVGISPGNGIWELRLEERMPAGTAEVAQGAELFELKLTTDLQEEVFSQCRWLKERREFTREGLRRIREGIALARQVK